MSEKLEHSDLLHWLRYDPETGFWTRLVRRSNQAAGSRADRLSQRKQEHYTVSLLYKIYVSHRLAWFYMTGEWPTLLVDHKDLDATNNRWDNLRLATKAQNAWNAPKHRDNSTGYKGIERDGKRFRARICVEGKVIRLGVFDTPQEAHAAYCEAATKYYGEFARHD